MQRIFETACELFYRRGIRAVGVDEIVKQAGVTKPSLYRAFSSKDELVAACLAESASECRKAIETLLAETKGGPREQLRALIAYYAQAIAKPDFRGCPLSNMAVEFPEPNHPGREVLESRKSEIRGTIASLTRQLPVRDPDALADGLVLILEGAMASHHIFGSQGPSSALASAAEALIEGHLKASVPA